MTENANYYQKGYKDGYENVYDDYALTTCAICGKPIYIHMGTTAWRDIVMKFLPNHRYHHMECVDQKYRISEKIKDLR